MFSKLILFQSPSAGPLQLISDGSPVRPALPTHHLRHDRPRCFVCSRRRHTQERWRERWRHRQRWRRRERARAGGRSQQRAVRAVHAHMPRWPSTPGCPAQPSQWSELSTSWSRASAHAPCMSTNVALSPALTAISIAIFVPEMVLRGGTVSDSDSSPPPPSRF